MIMNIANANVTKSKSKCDIGNSNNIITNAKRLEIYSNNKKINRLLGTKKQLQKTCLRLLSQFLFITLKYPPYQNSEACMLACIPVPLKASAILSGDTTIASCSASCASVAILSLNGCSKIS